MNVFVWCCSSLLIALLTSGGVKPVLSFETTKHHQYYLNSITPTTTTTTTLSRRGVSTTKTKTTQLSVSRFLDDTFNNKNTKKKSNNNNNDSSVNSFNNNNRSYLRWRKDDNDNTWNMETAVTTFERGSQKVDLHAQVHFGDKSYFDYYNSPEFNNQLDYVLYELLVDDSLLEYSKGNFRLKEPIMASPSDQNLAQQYGWDCQASTIDYTQNSKWIHADLSRQEFMKLTSAGSSTSREETSSSDQPLWKLAATAGQNGAAAEAVSALFVGPPTLAYDRASGLKRRLFTNLFLPGSNLANILRGILWMTVPSPELSIILLDWSSLLPEMNGSSGNGKGGSSGNPNALSKVAIPILSSMVKFDIPQIRRFLFGQVLMSSNNRNTNGSNNDSSSSAWSLLVTKRNDHALDVLQTTLSNTSSSSKPTTTTTTATSAALLYGSSHCPDLHMKLKDAGFKPIKTTWRTAWSIQENNNNSDDDDNNNVLPSIMAVLVLYLGIGACDWVATIGDVSESWIAGDYPNYPDFFAIIGLYLVRHVLIYLGLSKFLIDWTNNND